MAAKEREYRISRTPQASGIVRSRDFDRYKPITEGPASSVIENSLDLAFFTDFTGLFVHSNRKFNEAIGYSTEDLRNMSIYEVLTLNSMALYKDSITDLEHSGQVFDQRLEFNTRGGESVRLRANLVIVDHPEGILWNARAECAEHVAIIDFASKVAHDIRNCLTAPRITLDQALLMLSDEMEPQARCKLVKNMALAASELSRAVELTENMVLLSGTKNNHLTEIRVNSSLANMLLRLDLHDVNCETKFDESNPMIYMNRSMFDRAMINLMDNAVRAGAKNISVSTSIEGGNVIIRINDDGCGISKQDLPNIFIPAVSTRPSGGYGLGLAIVDQAISGAGGTITAESALNVGTTFTIRVPSSNRNP